MSCRSIVDDDVDLNDDNELPSDQDFMSVDFDSNDFLDLDHPTTNTVPPCSAGDKEPSLPLYKDASISVCGAYSAIMHFASRHKLSMNAIGDQIILLQLFVPTPNHLPTSLFKFRQYFNQFAGGYK